MFTWRGEAKMFPGNQCNQGSHSLWPHVKHRFFQGPGDLSHVLGGRWPKAGLVTYFYAKQKCQTFIQKLWGPIMRQGWDFGKGPRQLRKCNRAPETYHLTGTWGESPHCVYSDVSFNCRKMSPSPRLSSSFKLNKKIAHSLHVCGFAPCERSMG